MMAAAAERCKSRAEQGRAGQSRSDKIWQDLLTSANVCYGRERCRQVRGGTVWCGVESSLSLSGASAASPSLALSTSLGLQAARQAR
jgi:hypothetical protein